MAGLVSAISRQFRHARDAGRASFFRALDIIRNSRPDALAELADLARQVQRLSIDRRGDPEVFHVQKSPIVGRLRALARMPNGAAWPLPAPRPAVRVRIIERETVRVAMIKASLARRGWHHYPRPPSTLPAQGRLGLGL